MRHLVKKVLTALAVAAGVTALTAVPADAAGIPAFTIVVAPHGGETLQHAQKLARTLSSLADVHVELAGGTYRLSTPLKFTAEDSGRNGHTITWQGRPGQTPVLSGGQPVTGWKLHDPAANIFVADVPKGADSRQLYVDGASAPRAAITIARTDVQVTATGLTIVNPALGYLASLPAQNRIEVESQNSFTDRYSPVQSIAGTTITMQQPAWNNNNWGYDTLARPFAGGTLLLENSYSFLQTGQWYLDPAAGKLFYKAAPGQSPVGKDVELPRLTSLVQVSGTPGRPVRDLAFRGLGFEHTTWLEPGTSIGYADQQSGAFLAAAFPQPADFLTSCQVGCPCSRRRATAGTRFPPPSRSPRRTASRSRATRSPTWARSPSASATTPTRTRAASASARPASRCGATPSPTTPVPASSSAGCSPTRTTRATPRWPTGTSPSPTTWSRTWLGTTRTWPGS
ncbi:hypothetical protein ACIRSS_48165 [Amycolatopsis sp. NPDC101161]|uniref:hypothetical protein n=1 Tax=Amycolatopsis sp. NPDC101161 TaxID=3363940 RepID=UPI0038119E47